MKPFLLAAPLGAILCSLACAEDNPPPGAGVDVSIWDTIAARAAAFTGSGYSPDKGALADRPFLIDYYARNYPHWTDPAPIAPPPGKLRNLSDAPQIPRFPLTDKIWAATPGSASVCLWEDDKLAAFSFGVDDNFAPDVPFWEELSKKYGGLRITWNLISGNIGGAVAPRREIQGGTWGLWNQVLADGFHIASHSVEHVADPVPADGWLGPGWEAAESQRQLDAGLPGHRTKFFVYPGSPLQEFNNALSWRPVVPRYYAAARGPSTNPINRANQIDYFSIHTTSHPDDIFKYPAFNIDNMLARSADPELAKYYRGWLTTFIHGANGGKDWTTDPVDIAHAKVFDWVTAHRDDLWVGFMDDVALYGQERDTALLEIEAVDDRHIVLKLSSRMDPAVFDYPLTVKVRLPDAWKGAAAAQDGKPVPARFLIHEGVPYGLVKAVPDRGIIVLTAE